MAVVFSRWFGDGFDFNVVFLTQPGYHLLEMLSRLSIGLIEKKSDFQHEFLLSRIKLLASAFTSFYFLPFELKIDRRAENPPGADLDVQCLYGPETQPSEHL